MKNFLHYLFIRNWQRKYFSLFISLIVWLTLHHSLTTTKILKNLSIRIVNLSENKNIVGASQDGLLNRTVSLSITGRKQILEQLSNANVEILIDAKNKPDEWTETISKKNFKLSDLNLDLNAISQVSPINIHLKSVEMINEKLSIPISPPIGEAPRSYQFLDYWPYEVSLNVKATKETLEKIKSKNYQITFNLNDISKADLDNLMISENNQKSDIITYSPPEKWKYIYIPELSDEPLKLESPSSDEICLNFIKSDILSIDIPIPLNVYFPYNYTPKSMPLLFAENELIQTNEDFAYLNPKFYAKGVSQLFLNIVKNYLQIQLIPSEIAGKEFSWCVQVLGAQNLEEIYIQHLFQKYAHLASITKMKESYWRNRFRSYIARFELLEASGEKLNFYIEFKDKLFHISKREHVS